MKKPLKNLIIIGAGGFGREIYGWARQTKENGISWRIKGFLDDNEKALDNFKYDVDILSGIREYRPEANDLFVCAIGNMKLKKQIIAMILKKNGRFANIIHPTVVIGDNVRLGTGIILCPYSVVSSNAVLGDFVCVNLHASVGHDVKIGDWSFVGTGSAVNGNAVLDNSVFMGGHVIILPKSSIGAGTVVGAGSMVVGHVGSNITVFGIPAKKLRFPKATNR